MLPCAHLLSNEKSVPHGTHGVDIPGCYRTCICLEMRHTYYMVRCRIDIPYEYMLIYRTVVNTFQIVMTMNANT